MPVEDSAVPSKSPDGGAKQASLLRSAGVVGLMTLISRLTGVINQRILAHFLGIGAAADAFMVAYRLPNMLRRFTAEGTMTAAFLPTLSEVETQEGDEAGRAFMSRFMGTLGLVLLGLCALGVVCMTPISALQMLGRLAPDLPVTGQLQVLGQVLLGQRQLSPDVALSASLARIMFPYLALVSLTAGMAAVLNLRGRFALPASVSTFYNLAFIAFSLGCLWLGPAAWRVPERAVYIFAVAVMIGGTVQLLVILPSFFKLGGRLQWGLHFRHPAVRLAFRRMIPGILAAGIHPINVFISQMLASQLPKGAQTVLVQSNLLGELVLGLFAVSVATVSLPAMSRQAAAGDRDGVRRNLAVALRGTAVMAIPASVGLAVLAMPIVSLIFRTGRFGAEAAAWTAGTLAFQAIGLLFIASARISTQALNALKDYRGPALAAVLSFAVNIALSMVLMGPLGTAGMALANSCAAVVGLTFQTWRLNRALAHLPYGQVADGWLRMIAAAAAMGLLAYFGGRAMDVFTFHGVVGTSLRLFPLIAACAGMYLVLLMALQVDESHALIDMVKRRIRR